MRARRLAVIAWLVVASLACVKNSDAATLYVNDFEVGAGGEWTTSAGPPPISTTPFGGRRFLGEFTTEVVGLSWSGLPSHERARVELALFILRSWDGSNLDFGGPDTWSVALADGPTVFSATFSNVGGVQTYPDPAAGPTHPFQTGAVEVGTLGFEAFIFGVPVCCFDAVYHVVFDFPHADAELDLRFSASGLQLERYVGFPHPDESWGLDFVAVEAYRIPFPAALGLVASALAIGLGERLAGCLRRRPSRGAR